MMLSSREPRSSSIVPGFGSITTPPNSTTYPSAVMPNGVEDLLGQGPGGHAGRRFPGAGPFEHAPYAPQVLDRAGQVAVSGPRTLHIVEPLDFVVAVDHLQRNGTADRVVAPNAGGTSTRSVSIRCRPPRPYPPCRRRNSASIGSVSIGTPAGKPSTRATASCHGIRRQ